MSHLRIALFCLAATLPLIASAVDSGDWSQWRGPQRDSQLPAGTLPNRLGDRLELLWQKSLSPSYSGPVVLDGVVFTTETVDKRYEKVTALSLESGDVLWTQQWEGSMAVPFFAAANGDWIRATPACNEEALIVVGMRDTMTCLDPENGDIRWAIDFPKQLGTPLPMFGASCSPLIDGDSVYMQTGGATVRLSLKDGSVIWQTLNNADSKLPGAFSSPIIATIADVRQLLVQTRDALCGVDLETGTVLWQQPIESFRGMNILTPLVIGDTIFTSAHSGKAQRFQIRRSGDEWTVEEIWQQKQQAYMSSPVLVGERIFMHLKNERMTALSVATGEAAFTTRPMAKYVSMIAAGGQILGLTDGGDLLLIDATADEFRIVDQVNVAENSWAHLALSRDKLIVRDLNAIKVFSLAK